MKRLLNVVIFFVCTCFAGCTSVEHSPKLGEKTLKLEQEFYRRTAHVDPKMRGGSGKLLYEMQKLLDECIEPTRRAQYDRLVKRSAYTSPTLYDKVLVQAFVYRLAFTSNNVDSLRQLLAARCPEEISAS